MDFRRFPERNVSLLSLLGTGKSDHARLWEWSSGGISPEKEVAFLSMERKFLLPSREWTRGSHKMLKENPSSFFMLLGWNQVYVSSRDCLCVWIPWLGWWEFFSRTGNCHGIKTAVRRLQSRRPAVKERREGPPENQYPRLVQRMENHLPLNTTGCERNFEPLGI